MQMHEAEELIEARNLAEANAKLAEGWALLAVVSPSGTNTSPIYVLGTNKHLQVKQMMQARALGACE